VQPIFVPDSNSIEEVMTSFKKCAFSLCCSAGILIVVAIGVALGVFIGGTLLSVVAFCMKK
jgi:hypothetical protein